MKKPKKRCKWCRGTNGEINWLPSVLPNGAWICSFCFLGKEYDKRLKAGQIRTRPEEKKVQGQCRKGKEKRK